MAKDDVFGLSWVCVIPQYIIQYKMLSKYFIK